MAAFGGYPQSVTFSTVNVAKGGGSENLLINPRGKINQLNEPDGVLSAGVYFCDGWKAGASGAEVYRDADGFRLISGSIVQLVPNNLGAGRNLRANMDVISGAPVMSINGGSDNVVSSDSEYISLEISGNNSKFNRIILAESLEIPIYQQSSNELFKCLHFLHVKTGRFHRYMASSVYTIQAEYINKFHKIPALTYSVVNGIEYITPKIDGFEWKNAAGANFYVDNLVLDARP
ncbi:hypothetical protein CGT94_05060 [Vibrio metoecus]|uniref:hypothetical protein n=1 Tax=Vibrio metoecus TaxID=1481663 RepID=UPI0006D79B78|nr:hypothetical protein [Vibrio metoecus]KQB07362.1 hypothetical protein XV93_03635 [Vibrio metoecus]PAR50965.1 hypothetical protein CGT94_05060 [Vibrio metoecus]